MTKTERELLERLVARIKALETDIRNLSAVDQVSDLKYDVVSRYKADPDVSSNYSARHRTLNSYDYSGTPTHLPLTKYVRR